MKNQPVNTAAKGALGFRSRLAQMFTRAGRPAAKPRLVKVWDMQRDSYRDVDLNDRSDPLWPTARELYLFSKGGPRRTAA